MVNKQKIKVIVAVPVSDSAAMRAQTAQSIGASIIGAEGVVVDFLLRQSCDIVSNRTWLVRQALEKGATHIFFVDADMFFPSHTLKQLLSHNKDIVGLEYNKRKFPLEGTSQPLTLKSDEDLYKAVCVGMGVMLIKLDVFKNPKLGAPSQIHPRGNAWFSFGRDKEGALVLGEDVWFCNVARDAGYDVWVDPSIKVGHIGEYLY